MSFMFTVLGTVCFLAFPIGGQSQEQKVDIYNSVPPAAQALCEIPAGTYDKNPLTEYMCSTAGQNMLKAASQRADATGSCHIDPTTNKIICRFDSECEGGISGRYSKNVTEANITFDCFKDCHASGTLFLSCCDMCAVLQQDPSKVGLIEGKYTPDNVHCIGCGDKLKTALANDVDCTLVGSHYKCHSEGQCNSGAVSTHTSRAAYACQVEDCNKCSDKQLKADCCLKCSQAICSGSKQLKPPQRYACLGCTENNLFIPAMSSHSEKIQTGLIIAVVFAVIVLVGSVSYFVQQRNWARSASTGEEDYRPLGSDADHEAAIVE